MNTKESIQKTFIKLYSKMDYNSITIKELCIQTPIARTTFYSYYTNIDELKSDIEMSFLNGLRDLVFHFQEKNLAFIDLHEFLKCSMVYIENNWEAVYAFLVIQPDIYFIDKLNLLLWTTYEMSDGFSSFTNLCIRSVTSSSFFKEMSISLVTHL